jgi:hypothetical protein
MHTSPHGCTAAAISCKRDQQCWWLRQQHRENGGKAADKVRSNGTVAGNHPGISADQVVADVRFADYMQPTVTTAGYKHTWPGDVVLKIRNLPQALHKPEL